MDLAPLTVVLKTLTNKQNILYTITVVYCNTLKKMIAIFKYRVKTKSNQNSNEIDTDAAAGAAAFAVN